MTRRSRARSRPSRKRSRTIPGPKSFDREKLKEFGKNYPMERPAQPAELAPAYVFLASGYVNGEVLGVTGGKPLA